MSTYRLWTEDDERKMQEKVKAVEERNARALAEIIAANPDKEPFDFDELCRLYWRQSTVSGSPSSDSSERVRQEYMQRYYFSYPEVKTMRDFVKALEAYDAAGER